MKLPAVVEKTFQEALGSGVRIISATPLSGGCINHAMKVTTTRGDFFVKWNDEGPGDLFLREAECLEELEKAGSSLKIPAVIAKTALQGKEPGVLITEFLPPPESGISLDERLGRGLAELHRHTHSSFGFHHDNYCGSTRQRNDWTTDWVDFFGGSRIKPLVELCHKTQGFGAGDLKLFEDLLDKLPGLIGHDPSPSLIHGDLWSGNYMPTAAGPALIDPASCYADREFEFSIMNMFGGFSSKVYGAYNEVYPLQPEWKERNELYMLYHYLNHYYLFGGSYGSHALAIARRYVR